MTRTTFFVTNSPGSPKLKLDERFGLLALFGGCSLIAPSLGTKGVLWTRQAQAREGVI